MDFCRGLNDWYYCIRCPYLCTKSCPLENEDAFQRLSVYINRMKGTDKEGETTDNKDYI